MLLRILGSGMLLVLLAGAAAADRPVTDDERARLVAALATQGCSGGRMEFDEFGKSFGLLSKKLDD